LLVTLTPKPKLVLLLTNAPSIIWSRKQQDPLDEIEWGVRAYEECADRRHIPIVKTDVDLPELVHQFLEGNWRQLVRWRRRGIPRAECARAIGSEGARSTGTGR